MEAALDRECYIPVPLTVEELTDPRPRYPGVVDLWEARTLALNDYANHLLDELGNCNRQLRSLQTLVNRQAELEKKYHESRRGSD